MKRLIVSLFILTNFAFATTINVPTDYSTIQAGINASTDGDTVLVAAGTYVENINYNGKGTIGFSAHGFRATASTLLNEFNFRSDVIERQLAHKERNQSRASYNRAMYLSERQEMMQHWAFDFLASLTCLHSLFWL